MTEELQIALTNWHPFDSPDGNHANTLADIEIYAGEICLTELVDRRSKTTRKHVRASAYQLALWLANNFWRLRWETLPLFPDDKNTDWKLAHSMPAAGGGFIWPDITIFGNDGDLIQLECKATRTRRNSSIRYLGQFFGSVTAQSVENAISDFVEAVISRLYEYGFSETSLGQLWADIQDERGNSKSATSRRLEALLGLDPDQNSSLIEQLVRIWVPKLGINAVEEIGASTGWGKVIGVLATAESKSRKVQLHGRTSEFQALRSAIAPMNDQLEKPWEAARRLAYSLRDTWNIGWDGVTDGQLSEATGLTLKDLATVDPTLPFSFSVDSDDQNRFGVALARPREESRRFDVARLLGDEIAFDTIERIKPATAASTLRQKFQRAFAAEFLCPSKVVEERTSNALTRDELDTILEQTATDFGVSSEVVVRHFQNHGIPVGQTFLCL